MATIGGAWRLKALIIIAITVTAMYTVNATFSPESLGDQITEDGYIDYDQDSLTEHDLEYNMSNEGTDSGEKFTDVLFGLGDFLTFGGIDNTYARLLITSFVSIMFLCIGYLIYTFIRDWIPFVG